MLYFIWCDSICKVRSVLFNYGITTAEMLCGDITLSRTILFTKCTTEQNTNSFEYANKTIDDGFCKINENNKIVIIPI